MKGTHIYSLLIVLLLGLVPALAWAGSPAPAAPLTAKEEAKVSRLMDKMERKIERKMAKLEAKGELPQQTEEIDPYLKKVIIYAVIATVLGALYWIPIVGLILALGSLVFWILAILEFIKWIDTQ